jgi:hypothetical protein
LQLRREEGFVGGTPSQNEPRIGPLIRSSSFTLDETSSFKR